MSSFFEELKRRNVLKETIAYLVIAWLILQVFDVVLPIWNTPGWILQVITITLALGLPLWIIFSWNYEISTSGIKKTITTSNDQSKNTKLSTGLNTLIMVAITGIIALIWIKPDLVSSNFSSTNLVVLNNSIAVLPFDDMSSGGDTEWFCDGVRRDILTNLSKLKDLKVISRTSTERYKNTDKSIPEIAAELGVSYLVEGSVRKHEDKIIITAQLIDANDNDVWAQNYNDIFKEVFKIQQDVSQKIVNQLKIAISPEEEKEMNKLPTENIEAYKLVLQGRNFVDKLTQDEIAIAKKLFEQAIELDPNYADAYADLARATFMYNDGTLSRSQKGQLAWDLLNKALSLDINCSRAYALKGSGYSQQGNTVLAKENLDKALAINPNDAVTHEQLGNYYSRGITRDFEKATYHFDKALELEPFSISIIRRKIQNLASEENVEAAEILFEEKKSFIPENVQIFLNRRLVRARALASTKLHKDQNEYFKFYEEAINTFPEDAAYYYILIAEAYDAVLNDDEGYVKYTKMAYDLEPDQLLMVSKYLLALVENGQFERAMEVFESKNYKNLSDEAQKLSVLFIYYYKKRDFEMARSINENKKFGFIDVTRQTLTSAQLGDRKTVDSLLALPLVYYDTKAFVFAIYKERDSMYHYLNNNNFTINEAQFINSNHEFDPYRKEPRYIEFLKKYYFPIDQQKE